MNDIHHQVAAAYEGRTEEGRVDVSLSLFFGIWAYFFTYLFLLCLLNSMTRSRMTLQQTLFTLSLI